MLNTTPTNNIAIFNSLTENWNGETHFSQTVGVLTPLGNWLRLRLTGQLEAAYFQLAIITCTEAKQSYRLVGFDESFVAEDVALTLRLSLSGFQSQLLNLLSYDS